MFAPQGAGAVLCLEGTGARDASGVRGLASRLGCGALLSRGLIAETTIASETKADAALNRIWRNDEEGNAILLHITDAGLAAIGTAVSLGAQVYAFDVRPEVAEQMILDEEVRFREEDPFTDRFIAHLPARLVVHRSRFETDLNRVREEAVYREPDDAWGLDMWRGGTLDEGIAERSLEVYDAVYDELGRR